MAPVINPNHPTSTAAEGRAMIRKLTPEQIRPFIPASGITLYQLETYFSEAAFPRTLEAAKEFVGKVKTVATEVAGKYYPKQGAATLKQHESWSQDVHFVSRQGVARMSQYDADNEMFHHTVKMQSRDAFVLHPVILKGGPFAAHKALIMAPFTDHFRFLDLPPEIHTLVYELLLIEGNEIAVSTFKPAHFLRRPCRDSFRDKKPHQGLQCDSETGKWITQLPSTASSLLPTSKQIFKETAPILYGKNTFAFDSMKDMRLFLATIGSMRKHLRYLRLTDADEYKSSEAQMCFDMLKSAKTLRHIYLPHQVICKNLTRGPDDSGELGLVEDPEKMLMGLCISQSQMEKKGEGSRIGVLELFRFDWRECWGCRRSGGAVGEACASWKACGVECKGLAKHCREVAKRVRREVRKALEG